MNGSIGWSSRNHSRLSAKYAIADNIGWSCKWIHIYVYSHPLALAIGYSV